MGGRTLLQLPAAVQETVPAPRSLYVLDVVLKRPGAGKVWGSVARALLFQGVRYTPVLHDGFVRAKLFLRFLEQGSSGRTSRRELERLAMLRSFQLGERRNTSEISVSKSLTYPLSR